MSLIHAGISGGPVCHPAVTDCGTFKWIEQHRPDHGERIPKLENGIRPPIHRRDCAGTSTPLYLFIEGAAHALQGLILAFDFLTTGETFRTGMAGSPAWIRTTIHGSKGRCPTVRR